MPMGIVCYGAAVEAMGCYTETFFYLTAIFTIWKYMIEFAK